MNRPQQPADSTAELHYREADRPIRLLFLEEADLSTGGHLDHIYDYFRSKCTARYEKVETVAEAREEIAWADVVWLEWASELMAKVTRDVDRLKYLPVLARLHGFEVFTPLPVKFNWQVVDKLIFVAEHKRRIFHSRVPNPPVRDTVIRNGIDVDNFSVPPRKRNTKNLLLLGHINYRKGLPMLLQFYHELLQRDDEFHLFIRGDWQDTRYQLAAMTMMKELGIRDEITIVTEWIDDLDTWLEDKSHILSFSLEESFHCAIGNCMAAGMKPIIHAWTESRSIWPEQFIFDRLEGFLNLALSPTYRPYEYRSLLKKHKLTKATQLARMEEELIDVIKAPTPAT